MNKYYKQLEQTRLISYTVASTVPSKKKLPPIHRWMPLPTDKSKGISNERAKEMFKILKEQHGNQHTRS